MNKFFALLKKETLVLSKDIHGLLVLFVMPAVFILIMSLAMQNAFDERQNVVVEYALLDQSDNADSKEFIKQLQNHELFQHTLVNYDVAHLKSQVLQDKFKFAVIIPDTFSQHLATEVNNPENSKDPVVDIFIAPTVKPYLKQLFLAAIRSTLIKRKMALVFAGTGQDPQTQQDTIERMGTVNMNIVYASKNGTPGTTPSSVQQNVPAWLIFAMYFVIIPISTAFIIEKQQGTFVRLRLMNISTVNLLLAKLAPYYVVNQIQMICMIMVGMYVVPILGGDQLNWPSSLFGLLIVSTAASFAAIGFALMIATIAKTTVQATTMGGVFNIIFGALGGIMVPKFVMPATMQEITVISPMSWGLEGFLDVFLRNAQWQAVIPESIGLMIFGAICLAGAAALFRKYT